MHHITTKRFRSLTMWPVPMLNWISPDTVSNGGVKNV